MERTPTIAEFLETDHWTNPMNNIPGSRTEKVQEESLQHNSDKFVIEELNSVSKTSNLNRELGLDLVRMELFR